jgi:hypothetical protein
MLTSPLGGTRSGAERGFIKSGTLLIIGAGLVLLLGWFAYQPYIPPTWLHDLAEDISLRAAVDPNAAPPEDMRQATPRGLADSPYICPAKIIDIPWDHLYVVTASQDLRKHPVLAQASWLEQKFNDMADTLTRDKRYQLVVLVKDNAVTDAQLFYTFWAELDAIARPEGFNRASAVFTAGTKEKVYVVLPAENPPADVCAPND